MSAPSRHARVTDTARDSQYARSGEEAGFTAARRSSHVEKGQAETRRDG